MGPVGAWCLVPGCPCGPRARTCVGPHPFSVCRMSRMPRLSFLPRLLLPVTAAGLLAACGGGGDPATVAATGAAASAAVGTVADQAADQIADVLGEDSRWSMDNHTYTRDAAATRQYIEGSAPYTVISASAPSAGAGADTMPAAWRGSRLSIRFVGNATGTYHVVGSDDAFQAALSVGRKAIRIEVLVGTGSQGSQLQYDVTSGQVRVSRDASGVFHLGSTGNLVAVRRSNTASGGITDAPAQMSFSMHNVH